VPHELIGWTAKRGEQIAACLTESEADTSPPSTTMAS
jgi:hypothetical protein